MEVPLKRGWRSKTSHAEHSREPVPFVLRFQKEARREVFMKYIRWFLPILLVLVAVAAPRAGAADTGPNAGAMSLLHVRIVRLSFVQGEVAVRHVGETDWSAGAVNTPLQEGFSVATSANSFAEIEFENGSTARLGQGSEIDFTELALTQQGDRINKLTLSKGYATFHFMPEHHDQYEVDASGVTFTVHGKVEFRTNFEKGALRVEVFDGEVQAEHDGKTEDVGKNRVLTYDPHAVEALNVANGFEKDDWDKWTQARDKQAVLATDDESVSLNHPFYGWADLDTYGAWSFFPGYGYGWSPYEPAGWSPYSAGMWGYYPGWGFTWISAEPWGWLPFHNGAWNYDASMGWFWMPGSLDAWSPALVNWYDGPGWVGWSPIGSGNGACSITAAGCLTAVAPGTLEQGTPLRPGSPVIVHPIGINRSLAHTGTPQLQSSVNARPVTVLGPRISMRTTATAPTGAPAHAAPASVVMGRDVKADAFLNHHGFFSGPQVIHAPLGRTMGGTVPTVMRHDGEISIDSRYHGPQPAAVTGGGPNPNGAPRNAARPGPARVPVMMARGGGSAGPAGPSIDARGGISGPSPSAMSSPGMAPSPNAGASAPMARPSAPPAAAPAGRPDGAGRVAAGAAGRH